MNIQLFTIFLLSFTLLSHESKQFKFTNKAFYKYKRRPKNKEKLAIYTRKEIALLKALNSGDKSLLSRKKKSMYKDLGLLHLFTPSGIHLLPIGFMMKKLFPRWMNFLLNTLAYIFFFKTKAFWSIRRILMLKNLNTLSPHLFFNFLACFVFDFALGSYAQSPLSFCFSFLFLGSVIFSKSKIRLVLSLYFSQFILAYFFSGIINPVAPLFGVILTSIFTFIFPFSFIDYWLFYQLDWGLKFSFMIDFYDTLVAHLHQLAFYIPCLEVSYSIILLGFVFLLRHYRLGLIILLLISNDLNNIAYQSSSRTFYHSSKIKTLL